MNVEYVQEVLITELNFFCKFFHVWYSTILYVNNNKNVCHLNLKLEKKKIRKKKRTNVQNIPLFKSRILLCGTDGMPRSVPGYSPNSEVVFPNILHI